MVGSTCSPRCLGKLVISTALALLWLGQPQTASAQTKNCIQDEYGSKLNCTANDVRIAKAINTRALDGTSVNQCTPNQPLTFIADFLVQTTAKSTRSNIGLYLGLDQAAINSKGYTGFCSDNIIGGPGRYSCPGQTANTPLCGSSHYDEFDTSPDNCGDSSSTDPTVYLGPPDQNGNAFVVTGPVAGGSTWTSTQVVTVEIQGFTCPNTPGQLVTLPDCTSWQVPGQTLSCVSDPNTGFPYVPTGALPGTSSKCNCSTVTLPIRVQSPQITVTKNCTTSDGSSNYPTSSSCTAPDPGTDTTTKNVTYSVKIDNTSDFGDIEVDQICDSKYGTVYRNGSATSALAACNPTLPGIPSTDFTCSGLGDVSTNTTCSFKVFQPEATTVTDIVTVYFHGLSVTGPVTYLSSQSNLDAQGHATSISVAVGEDPTTASISGSALSLVNACETVTYSATVTNTTSAAEETLNVSKVYDNNVDLTTLTKTDGTPNGILGTTCGVATGSPGLGTLSGLTGGGILPATVTGPSGSYTCDFQTQYCATPSTVVKTPGVCGANGTCTAGATGSCQVNSDCNVTCLGIQAPNSITAGLTDDEGTTITVGASGTVKPGSTPATMCVSFP